MKKPLEERQADMRERQEGRKAVDTKPAEAAVSTCFQPGQSGNSAGRPKLRLNAIARAHADSIDPKDTKKRRRIERVLDELYSSAVTLHSVRAAEEYLSRAIGKPLQTVDQNVTITSREEDLKFLLEELGLGGSSESIQ
jgi:hypothetical protein